MVQAIVTLGDEEDRVLTIVRGKFGIKNKSDAVNFVIKQYAEEMLEPQLRPEFVEKIQRIEKKGRFKEYHSLSDFRKEIEHA